MATFPLSYNQLSVWYMHAFAPESPAYNLEFRARITSPLDPDRLERAINDVIAQTPMLRTTISAESGTPLQTVHDSWPLTLDRHDASGLSDEQLSAAVLADYERPFDLAARPGVRASLYRHADDDHVLLLTVHQAFADTWGITLVVDRMCRAYAGEELQPPQGTYENFARWQQEFVRSEEGIRQRDHWEGELGAAPTVLDPPPDKPRPPGI